MKKRGKTGHNRISEKLLDVLSGSLGFLLLLIQFACVPVLAGSKLPFIPDGFEFSGLLVNLALSYTASYFFFLLVVQIPAWRDRHYSRKIAERRLSRLLSFSLHLEEKLRRLSGLDRLDIGAESFHLISDEHGLKEGDSFSAERSYMRALISEIISLTDYVDLKLLDQLDELESAVGDLYFLYEEPGKSFQETHGPKIVKLHENIELLKKVLHPSQSAK